MNTTTMSCVFKAEREHSDLLQLITDIQNSNMLSGDADIVSVYEKQLANFFKVKYAIAVSSGTAALHATIESIIQAGDEVLVPAIAVSMTVLPILQASGTPIFYDCQPDNLKPDLVHLEKLISPKTKVLVTVPMWGYPALDQQIIQFAKERGLIVVEDTAQALGTKQNGQYLGTIGDIGCFSTQEFKLLSTGEGGFVLTNNDSYADKIYSFANIGFDKSMGDFGYRVGLNYKLSALQASLGLSQLKRLSQKIHRRQNLANLWQQMLYDESQIVESFNNELQFEHNGYAKLFKIKHTKPDLAIHLAKSIANQGLITSVHHYGQKLMPQLPVLAKFYTDKRYSQNLRIDFPHALNLFDSLVILPTHDQISKEQIAPAAKIILDHLAKPDTNYA